MYVFKDSKMSIGMMMFILINMRVKNDYKRLSSQKKQRNWIFILGLHLPLNLDNITDAWKKVHKICIGGTK